MALLRLIEFILVVGGAYIITTQVIFPLFEGRVLFPFFREKKFVAEYREVKQEAAELEMKAGIEEIRKSNSEKVKGEKDGSDATK